MAQVRLNNAVEEVMAAKPQPKEEEVKVVATTIEIKGDIPQFQGAPPAELTAYPHITQKTIEQLNKNKITTLFPIQSNCFYPIF
jgi:hypothetical protein